MALLNQSTKAASAAVQEIADSAGASADNEMLTRGLRSLQAATEHFNVRGNWDYLLTETSAQIILAPFSANLTAVSAITSATADAGHGILVDDLIVGGGINVDCRVTATGTTIVGLSVPTLSSFGATPSGNVMTVYRDMYSVPSDFRKAYSIRLYAANTTLRPINPRMYDRSITQSFVPSTPVGYTWTQVAQRGKLQFMPIPATADTYGLKYYRRMYVATATGDTTPLDILQDYEPYMIAWAKWHFLTDKGEGRSQQAAAWLQFAESGIKQMISDQSRQPDEDLMFSAGQFSYNPAWGPNSIRNTLDGWGWT